ncbi:MAG: hypothetical protein VX498_03460, partial [Myxococcota bacterium]|nr:hypothetical protein [Myxococcota bacterium]
QESPSILVKKDGYVPLLLVGLNTAGASVGPDGSFEVELHGVESEAEAVKEEGGPATVAGTGVVQMAFVGNRAGVVLGLNVPEASPIIWAKGDKLLASKAAAKGQTIVDVYYRNITPGIVTALSPGDTANCVGPAELPVLANTLTMGIYQCGAAGVELGPSSALDSSRIEVSVAIGEVAKATGSAPVLIYGYGPSALSGSGIPDSDRKPLFFWKPKKAPKTWPAALQIPDPAGYVDPAVAGKLQLVVVLDVDGDGRLSGGDFISQPVGVSEAAVTPFQFQTELVGAE